MFLHNEFAQLGGEIENPKDTLDPIGLSVSHTEPDLFHLLLLAFNQLVQPATSHVPP